jgi:hypothetical protein
LIDLLTVGGELDSNGELAMSDESAVGSESTVGSESAMFAAILTTLSVTITIVCLIDVFAPMGEPVKDALFEKDKLTFTGR